MFLTNLLVFLEDNQSQDEINQFLNKLKGLLANTIFPALYIIAVMVGGVFITLNSIKMAKAEDEDERWKYKKNIKYGIYSVIGALSATGVLNIIVAVTNRYWGN